MAGARDSDPSIFGHLHMLHKFVKEKIAIYRSTCHDIFSFHSMQNNNFFSVLSEGTFEKAPLFLGPAKIAFASDVRLHYFGQTGMRISGHFIKCNKPSPEKTGNVQLHRTLFIGPKSDHCISL